MTTESSRRACDLLRFALDLLQDEDALIASAMIEGALDVLERNARPAEVIQGNFASLVTLRPNDAHAYRSCA